MKTLFNNTPETKIESDALEFRIRQEDGVVSIPLLLLPAIMREMAAAAGLHVKIGRSDSIDGSFSLAHEPSVDIPTGA